MIRVFLKVEFSVRFSMKFMGIDKKTGRPHHDGRQVITAHGSFLTVNAPSQLVYTWVWEGVFPDMPITYVTVDFREVDGGTEMALRQDDLSLRVCAQHLRGWLDAFGRLSAEL
jgi:uncharacterized protein YndB with AHSA1/START domain